MAQHLDVAVRLAAAGWGKRIAIERAADQRTGFTGNALHGPRIGDAVEEQCLHMFSPNLSRQLR